MKIFILKDSEETGPFSKTEIFAKLQSGAVSMETEARLEDEQIWRPLSEILNNNGASLYSLERIDAIQADLPEAPLVPIIQEKKVSAVSAQRQYSLKKWAVPAILLAVSITYLLYHRPGELSEANASTASTESNVNVSTRQGGHEPASSVVASKPPPKAAVKNTKPETSQSKKAPNSTVASTNAPAKVAPIEQPRTKPITEQNPNDLNIAPPERTEQATEPVPTQPKIASPKPSATPRASQPTKNGSVNDFFKISSIKLLTKEPKDTVGVWKITLDKNSQPEKYEFQQCLEVKASTALNARSDRMKAKVYFFDEKDKLVAKQNEAELSGKMKARMFNRLPVYFTKDKAERFFFKVPDQLVGTKWKAVVIFGDGYELQSACYPPTESDFLLSYPEKNIVYDRTKQRIERKPAIDPLVEYKVKTRNPKMPEFTIFLRPPPGVYDASEVQGVLAICYLANHVDELRTELQKVELGGDYGGLYAFAKKHRLAVIAWAAKGLWDPNANYDQLPKDRAKEIDKGFDYVANAWERGVNELADKYGIPRSNFLLWGSCGSAQWAHRLCLRKPDYFLAIDIHLPGSFDKPTKDASKVLWCLTTGELYGGYQRANDFVKECRNLGYPILYKPIVGLGHAGHPDASSLGLKFLEFALTQKNARTQYDLKNLDSFNTKQEEPDRRGHTWLEIFNSPPFFGDFVNQELYSADEVEQIPEAYRTPIPTEELATIWARSR